MEMEREGDLRKNLYPIGELSRANIVFFMIQQFKNINIFKQILHIPYIITIGNGDKKINMDFVHAVCFQEAKRLWDRRKERVNRDRMKY